MFERQINFLPEETKRKEVQEQKQAGVKNPHQVVYSKPASALPETPKEVNQQLKKENPFKKFGRFVKGLFKSKKVHAKAPLPSPQPPRPAPIKPLPDKKYIPAPSKIAYTHPNQGIAKGPGVKQNILKEITPKKPAALKKPQTIKPGFTTPSIQQTPSPDETEVNLVPFDVALRSAFRRKITLLIVGIFLSLAIVAGSFFSVRFYADSFSEDYNAVATRISNLEEELITYENYLSSTEELSRKINLVQELVTNHSYWSKFLTAVEEIAHLDADYHSFLADDSGQASFNVTVPDFRTLAEQVLILKNSETVEDLQFSAVSITPATEEEPAKVGFSLTVKFASSVFLYSE